MVKHKCTDCNHDCGTHCPRVAMRMECPECEYGYSEAMLKLDENVPHGDCPSDENFTIHSNGEKYKMSIVVWGKTYEITGSRESIQFFARKLFADKKMQFDVKFK